MKPFSDSIEPFASFTNKVRQRARAEVESFQSGRIAQYYTKWRTLTSDELLLSWVKCYKIELINTPCQAQLPKEVTFSREESIAVSKELTKLLTKDIIERTCHEPGEFVSNIFLRPKKDGSYRMILNLRKFNEYVAYHHFKMEGLHLAIQMMTPGCYMASIDLKDAYYAVPIAEEHRKYLKFMFKGQLYRFKCFVNGLAPCPRIFTKLLKVPFSHLRKDGHLSVAYIDDTFLQGEDIEDCQKNIRDTVCLLSDLGFVIHPEKSVLEPTQEIEFLGFLLNSVSMRVSISEHKANKIKALCLNLIETKTPSIREVAKVVGSLVACFPGVLYGPLYYRRIDIEKNLALKEHRGNFDKRMSLSSEAKTELLWWANNIHAAYKPINSGKPQITIETDASLSGWGAVCRSLNLNASGIWGPLETDLHINVLELKAVLLALKSFAEHVSAEHVLVLSDNMTTVVYVREMGGSHSEQCNDLTREIWQWAKARDTWLSIAHLPGKLNCLADFRSRNFNFDTEWKLNVKIFQRISREFRTNYDIDLFAAHDNYQLKPFISWKPDPEAQFIDAFAFSWTEHLFWAFPPFSLLQRVVQKIIHDQATGVLLVPRWPTQPWFPAAMRLLIQDPLLLESNPLLLTIPSRPSMRHPNAKSLQLLACHVSGRPSLSRAYRQKQQKS